MTRRMSSQGVGDSKLATESRDKMAESSHYHMKMCGWRDDGMQWMLGVLPSTRDYWEMS